MVAHMAVALLLGWVVGYERYFKGRAAGSQVYCLVCVTSCAVTLLAGFPSLWYWGQATDAGSADPTKVVAPILTGIGFLGAGIIVKSGLNVRGLTTAASIWGSSAIGILVGVGFVVMATGLTALFVACVALVPSFEQRLPARAAISTSLRFREGYKPSLEDIHRFVASRGMSIPADSRSRLPDPGEGRCPDRHVDEHRLRPLRAARCRQLHGRPCESRLRDCRNCVA